MLEVLKMSNEFKWTISPVNKQPAKLVLDYLIERGRDLEKQTEGKVLLESGLGEVKRKSGIFCQATH